MDLNIVGSGLGRTGTMSLKMALEHLTEKPCFHMVELLKKPSRLSILKKGHKNGNIDWRLFFEGYGSAVDYPICLYIEEYLRLNPKLKVIHTARDAESWYESVRNTIYRGVPQGPADVFRLIKNSILYKDFRRVAPVFMFNEKLIWKGQFASRFKDKGFAIEKYHEHEQKIKDLIPEGQLLLFDVRDGWSPLCHFLGVEEPNIPFPKTNEKEGFNRKMDLLLEEGRLEF